jgi:thioredoxin-related protein
MNQKYSVLTIRLPVLFVLLFSFYIGHPQHNDLPKTIPPFRIQLANGDSLIAKQLKKNTPVMIVYFDPGCEHCQAFTRNLLEKSKSFDKIQIVYISYASLQEVQIFEKDLNLRKYPNFKIGTEGSSFSVLRVYRPMQFPFIALYDKKGMLISSYKEIPPIQTLIQQFESKG